MSILRILPLWLGLALPASVQSLFAQDAAERSASGEAAAQLVEILSDEAALQELIRQLQSAAETATTAVSVLSDLDPLNWADLSGAVSALLIVAAVTLGLFLALRMVGNLIFSAMAATKANRHWLFSLVLVTGSSAVDALIIVLAGAGGYAVYVWAAQG